MAKTLINRSRRRMVFQLAHPAFMKKRWGYQVLNIRTHDLNPRTGAVGIREQRKGFSGSLTLLKGQVLTGLPDAIAAVPDVARAVRCGAVVLRDTSEVEVQAAASAEATAQAQADMPPKAKPSKAKAKGGEAQ